MKVKFSKRENTKEHPQYMYLKILFLDSSAILSWFLKNDVGTMQAGGKNVMDIHNEQTRIPCSLNISQTVYDEVIKKLKQFYKDDNIIIRKYISLLNDFYLIDKNQKDVEKIEERRGALINRHPDLKKKRNSQDSRILNELISYLEIFTGKSGPILVSCDNNMNNIASLESWNVFNPREKSIEDLKAF